jgi:hypothetical protein
MQVQMANEAAAQEGLDVHFDFVDAEEPHFDECFDVLWWNRSRTITIAGVFSGAPPPT